MTWASCRWRRWSSRLERAFASLERLPRFRGHFYNWYDLHDLRELAPAYVSTVDSGNLAGLLIAVRQACLGIPDEPVFDRRAWRAAETALRHGGSDRQRPASSRSSGWPARPWRWRSGPPTSRVGLDGVLVQLDGAGAGHRRGA